MEDIALAMKEKLLDIEDAIARSIDPNPDVAT